MVLGFQVPKYLRVSGVLAFLVGIILDLTMYVYGEIRKFFKSFISKILAD